MIIGDPAVFAIESVITVAYERLGVRGLGFFLIHVKGQSYGVREPDATMLACSLDEVERRIASRGKHVAPFVSWPQAREIAEAFSYACYALDQENKMFLDLRHAEFRQIITSSRIEWAPDGDEAFDDGSFVLQFDANDQVRLIAFRRFDNSYEPDPATLADVWLTARDYYRILQEWHDVFLSEWRSALKSPEPAGTF